MSKKVPVVIKIIKVAIKAIGAVMLFVLGLLWWCFRFIADWIAGQNIPYWDLIKVAVSVFPQWLLPPAIVAMYVLAIVEVIHGEHSRAAVTAIVGTCFLGCMIILPIVRREQRQAELAERFAERSFRDKNVAPLPSEAGELYDEIIAASDVTPGVQNVAKALVTIPSQVECGNMTRESAKSIIGIGAGSQGADDYRLQRLANVLTHVIDQMPLVTPPARAETPSARAETHAAQPGTRQSQNRPQVVWTEQELAYNRAHCPAWVASHRTTSATTVRLAAGLRGRTP
jgi:hypothetical protein